MKSDYFSFFSAVLLVLSGCDNAASGEAEQEIAAHTDKLPKAVKKIEEVKIDLDIKSVRINQYRKHVITLDNIGQDMPGNAYFVLFTSHGSDPDQAVCASKGELWRLKPLKSYACESFSLGRSEIAPNPYKIVLDIYECGEEVFSNTYDTATRKMGIPAKGNSINLKVTSHWAREDKNFWFDIKNIGEAIPESTSYFIAIRTHSANGSRKEEIRGLEIRSKGNSQKIKLGASEIADGDLTELELKVYPVRKKFSKSFDIRKKIQYFHEN